MQIKLVVKTKFPFIPLSFPPPVSDKFPDGNFCETVFPHFTTFPRCGGDWFPCKEILFRPTHWGNAILQFSPNFPRIPNDSYWFPLISQYPVQFSIQLHKCTSSSLSIRPILCILHVSLKMRIPYFARQRNKNLGNCGGNSWKFWGNQTKSFSFVFTHFHRCEIHFPLGEI